MTSQILIRDFIDYLVSKLLGVLVFMINCLAKSKFGQNGGALVLTKTTLPPAALALVNNNSAYLKGTCIINYI